LFSLFFFLVLSFFSGTGHCCGVDGEGNKVDADIQQAVLEVNMEIEPRTLHILLLNKQRPLCIVGIPSSLRFFVGMYFKDALARFISLKQLRSPSIVPELSPKKIMWK
jgi:hypothetical protein